MFMLDRRSFLASCPVLLAPSSVLEQSGGMVPSPLLPSFPTQEPDLVREMVAVSHGNVARVRQLLAERQSLARATWDWGFGDWESALGAASHIGHPEIAELLISHGARPTLFSAAMLGQLAVVKAFIDASPGVQRVKGPHGITLLSHATAGGARAAAVVEYLKQVGGADEAQVSQPLTPEEMTRLAGQYQFGSGADERIEIALARDLLTFARAGRAARTLFHVGGLEFFPTGAPGVRIGFSVSGSEVWLTVRDPAVVMTARKSA